MQLWESNQDYNWCRGLVPFTSGLLSRAAEFGYRRSMRGKGLVCLLLAGGLWAAEIECPKTVQVRQVPTDVPAGWTASQSAAPVTLSHVTFFDGKPEEEASLVYDRMTNGRTTNRAEWNFAPGSHIWLACSYSGASVVLSRELPGIRRCVVVYRRNPAGVTGLPAIEHIYCR